MKKEEKELQIKDLCGRLPYGALVFIRKPFGCVMSETEEELTTDTLQEFIENDDMRVFPYLRPMSSITDEEKEYCGDLILHAEDWISYYDYLDSRYLDYRGLIEKGLALEAPEGMYEG